MILCGYSRRHLNDATNLSEEKSGDQLPNEIMIVIFSLL
jgi:hypothetical protein